jgi:outer membrane protein assembly factor BamB
MTNESCVDQNLITTRIIEGKPKHNVIYSAATGKDGKIYLGLSAEFDSAGVFGQLICYDPVRDCFEDIADFADIIKQPADSLRHPHSKIHTSICVGNDGKVFASTHMTAPPVNEDFYHYWHVYNDPMRSFQGSRLIMYDPGAKTVKDFGVIAPKCGCRWMTYNPEAEELYLTTFLTAHFIVVKVKTGEVRDLGRISQYDFMGPCYSADGFVYTTDCFGFILRYSPKDGSIVKLPVKIPNAPWRSDDGNGVFHFVPGPDKIKLYGVAALGQRVFEFDPTAGKCGEIRDYGTLTGEDRPDEYLVDITFPRTITVGKDNKIYVGTKNYASGIPGSTIVAIDIDSGEKTYHGLMKVDGFSQINTPVASCTGLDGSIYFTAEQPSKESPLQIIIFNPCGINKPMPEYTGKYKFKSANATAYASYEFSYYLPTRDKNSIFITTGNLYAQELGSRGRVPLIPRNECAIGALMMSKSEQVLFGATSGGKSHFFCYLPFTKKLIPLNVLSSTPAGCRCMVKDKRGVVYMGTMGLKREKFEGHLYRYDAPANNSKFIHMDDLDKGEFNLTSIAPSGEFSRIDDLGAIAPQEGVVALCYDQEYDRIYGITTEGNFYIYDIASQKKTLKPILDEYIVKKNNIPHALLYDDGIVYFSGLHGQIIAYDPRNDAFRMTSMKIPVGQGREYLNYVTCLIKSSDNFIYGGTFADGFLFRFDPRNEELYNLGKPGIESQICSLTSGSDGMIWGLSGGPDELTHLFRFNPKTNESKDLGMMRSRVPRIWTVHKADVLITGADGELFIGESDAISHLLIYYPPIEKR